MAVFVLMRVFVLMFIMGVLVRIACFFKLCDAQRGA